MLKYSSLILLTAVAISWTCAAANPMPAPPLGKRAAPHGYQKRSSEDETSEEMEEKFIKELIVGLLTIAADDTSSEERILSERFKEAMDQKWDSLDDFEKHVAGIYEEVTGKKPHNSSESDE